MKLTVRINLLFTVIVSCILLGMTLLIYHVSRDNVQRDFRQRIKTRAARTAYLYNLFRYDTTSLLESMDTNSPTVLYNKSIQIYDTGFHLLYAYNDSNIKSLAPDLALLKRARNETEVYLKKEHHDFCVYYFPENTIPLFVSMSAEDTTGKAYINSLKKIFLLYVPLAILITLLVGYLFSRTIIRPVKETIHDVKLITSQNLSHRLYAGSRKDELAELNNTFNALLDRLEESFAIEKRFIANASHELSTPLTSISSQIEVALLQERNAGEYKNVLASVLKDTQGLHELTRNLLEIAKAGTNGAISLEKVRPDEILIKAHSEVMRQNNGFKIELEFSELPEDENECHVFGNAHLLHSAFKNIMENGCKYSPDRRTKVSLLFHGKDVEIIFSNKSDLLPAEEVERLFEPFYRGSNTGNEPGMGLGLTLTRRIISLHKGSLNIKTEPVSDTHIIVRLPALT